ncbi:MAG: hypothetical protein ABI459_07260, partial [Deltaproteobacteria bacterium]
VEDVQDEDVEDEQAHSVDALIAQTIVADEEVAANEPDVEVEPEIEAQVEAEDAAVLDDEPLADVEEPIADDAEEIEDLPDVEVEEPVAASKSDSIDDLVSILSAAVPGAQKSAPTLVAMPEPSEADEGLTAREVSAIRETWADMQSRYNIDAMPRLAHAMTALLDEFANADAEALARAPVEPEVEEPEVEDDFEPEMPTERRFVRGLF